MQETSDFHSYDLVVFYPFSIITARWGRSIYGVGAMIFLAGLISFQVRNVSCFLFVGNNVHVSVRWF